VDLDELTRPERALWKAFPCGELVDLSGARGTARHVRAEVIGALLLGAVPAEPGGIAAVRLDGARVTGTLRLGHSVIPGPVWLRGCEFDAGIDLSGARTRDFVLDGARLAGLAAPLAEIDGNLGVIGATCSGQVVLTGAHITGALQMQRSLLDNPGQVALLANRLVVDDDLLAHEATLNGEMRLAGAQVGGIVGLDGAESVDLLVPLVNFGLRDAYDPQGGQRWLAYLLIAVGWIFVTTIAAGIARVLRRQ